jgi:hypothetical protein
VRDSDVWDGLSGALSDLEIRRYEHRTGKSIESLLAEQEGAWS